MMVMRQRKFRVDKKNVMHLAENSFVYFDGF